MKTLLDNTTRRDRWILGAVFGIALLICAVVVLGAETHAINSSNSASESENSSETSEVPTPGGVGSVFRYEPPDFPNAVQQTEISQIRQLGTWRFRGIRDVTIAHALADTCATKRSGIITAQADLISTVILPDLHVDDDSADYPTAIVVYGVGDYYDRYYC